MELATVTTAPPVESSSGWTAPPPLAGDSIPAPARREPGLLSVFTLVLWLGCLGIGGLGFVLPYSRPVPPVTRVVPTQAKLLVVELTRDPLPPLEPAPAPASTPAPPILEPLAAPPAAPPMVAVAEPSPAVAFALPVEGPVRVVSAAQASYARQPANTNAVVAAAPAVQSLTFGVGDGRQPAPNYPVEARRRGQEGTVKVRFSVDEQGRVLAAESAAPSVWSILNSEAVRTVRERWRFRPGSMRQFEVAIRFELQK